MGSALRITLVQQVGGIVHCRTGELDWRRQKYDAHLKLVINFVKLFYLNPFT